LSQHNTGRTESISVVSEGIDSPGNVTKKQKQKISTRGLSSLLQVISKRRSRSLLRSCTV